MAGFVAPPVAFNVLADRALAGSIAGMVLGRYAMVALVSGVVYIVTWFLSRMTARPFSKRLLAVVVLALAVIAVSHWYVTPQIADLRVQMHAPGAASDLQLRFDAMHTLSVWLFGFQWLLAGLALVLHTARAQSAHHAS